MPAPIPSAEYCPECDSENTEQVDEGDTYDQDASAHWFDYLCHNCRCEFEVITRCETEVEVTKHGEEYDDEE